MLPGGAEPVVVAVEAAAEQLIASNFAAEAIVFVADLVALVEQGLGAVGEFVERGADGGDLVAGLQRDAGAMRAGHDPSIAAKHYSGRVGETLEPSRVRRRAAVAS